MKRILFTTIAFLLPLVAGGEEYPVTTTADDVTGSLRRAINTANQTAEDDTILVPPGTYLLTVDEELEIDDASGSGKLTIRGTSQVAADTVLDAGGNSRVLAFAEDAEVVLENLTITGGRAPDGNSDGGGILNRGNLTILNCVITENQAGPGGRGGGLFSSGIQLVVDGSVISNNQAGHGVSSGNGGSGGGIHLEVGQATIVRTTFSDNRAGNGNHSGWSSDEESAVGGNGGGIASNSEELLIEQSTFFGNAAGNGGTFHDGGAGGGLYNNGTVTVVNTTLVDNVAGQDGGYGGHAGKGGAIENQGIATIRHCTLYGNRAGVSVSPENSGTGGGVSSGSPETILTVENTVIVGNTDGTGAEDNLFDAGSGTIQESGWNFLAGNPMLLPLADNGGPTLTMLPVSGSPLVNAAIQTPDSPSVDQRGFDRPADPHTLIRAHDIGAVQGRLESSQVPLITVTGNGEVIPVLGQSPLITDGTDFGTVVGTESVTSTFEFTNEGDIPIHVFGIEIWNRFPGRAPNNFRVSSNHGDRLEPLESATFAIEYRPAMIGEDVADVTIDTSSGWRNFRITGSAGPGSYEITAGDSESLRQAILNAALDSAEVTLEIPAGAYPLTPGGALLLEQGKLNLVGQGDSPGDTVLDAEGNSRVLEILAGAEVLLENLTITGGKGQPGEEGGGILSSGNLTLRNVEVRGNQAGEGSGGGGIAIVGGELAAERCVIAENRAGNQASLGGRGGSGGGILAEAGVVQLVECTISGNQAGRTFDEIAGGDGGGIENRTSMTITRSTISSNVAGEGGEGGREFQDHSFPYQGGWGKPGGRGGNGGGISSAGSLTLVNCTVVGNVAGKGGRGGNGISNGSNSRDGGDGGTGGSGAAIDSPGPLHLVHCTVYGNAAGAGGDAGSAGGFSATDGNTGPAGEGGVRMAEGSIFTVENSIVAGNAASPEIAFEDTFPSLSGVNFLSGDPMLGPLANNGGPTQTMLPLVGSPLIDAAATTNSSPSLDQRGENRIFTGVPDIGSVEWRTPNDSWTNAIILDSLPQTIQYRLLGATAEAGEPVFLYNSGDEFENPRSLWWRWVAPQDGILRLPQPQFPLAPIWDDAEVFLTGITIADLVSAPAVEFHTVFQTQIPTGFQVVAGQTYDIRIADDYDEFETYQNGVFARSVEFTPGVPEGQISGNGITISDGDATPTSTDGTFFGQVEPGNPITRTFSIENIGTASFTLDAPGVSLLGSPAFSILSPLPTENGEVSLSPGESWEFEIQFLPAEASPGLAGTVSVHTSEGDLTFDVLGSSASAVTEVTSTTDGETGSLRALIETASDRLQDAEIEIPAGTYQLNAGELVLQGGGQTITLRGEGETRGDTIIDGNQLGRVLNITGGVEVILENLTITGGQTPAGESGGGIRSNGNLTLRNVDVTENVAGAGGGGGGIHIVDGVVLIEQSTVSLNRAGEAGSRPGGPAGGMSGGGGTTGGGGFSGPAGDGGGFLASAGTIQIVDSTIAGNLAGHGAVYSNQSGGNGGGIRNAGANLTILRSTIVANQSGSGGVGGTTLFPDIVTSSAERSGYRGGNGGAGGGISNSGVLRLENVTITDNGSGNGGDGGDGLHPHYNFDPEIGYYLTREAGNGGNGGDAGHGAGLFSDGTITVVHSTVTGNQAGIGGSGGSAHFLGTPGNPGSDGFSGISVGAGDATVENSIVVAFGGASGLSVSQEATLVETGVNFLSGDPMLGDLADNGGPTETMLPLVGSPLVDAAAPTGDSPETDQRGISRQVGSGPDIGAVEASSHIRGLTTVNGEDGVQLDWESNPFVSAVRILRGSTDDPMAATDIVTLPGDAISYLDTTGDSAVEYYYFAQSTVDGRPGPVSVGVVGKKLLSASEAVTTTNSISGVQIDWSAVAGAAGYRIYRGSTSDSTQAVQIAETDPSTFTFADSTGTPGVEYFYFLSHFLNEWSPLGPGSAGTHLVLPAPGPITAAGDAGGVNLWWGSIADVTGYQILRGTTYQASSAQVLASVSAEVTSYSDTSASPGQLYFYFLRYVLNETSPSSAGVSARRIYESSASVRTSTGHFEDRIQINWDAVSGATEYIVFRNITAGPEGAVELMRVGAEQLAAFDFETATGAGNYYAVKAVMPGGEASDFSEWSQGYRSAQELYRPDAMIGKSMGSLVGDGVYGGGQEAKQKAGKKGVSFNALIQNDGINADTITASGTKGGKLKMSYYALSGGRSNVTGAILTGSYSAILAPGGAIALQVESKKPKKSKKKKRKSKGGSFVFSVSSHNAPERADAVKGTAK